MTPQIVILICFLGTYWNSDIEELIAEVTRYLKGSNIALRTSRVKNLPDEAVPDIIVSIKASSYYVIVSNVRTQKNFCPLDYSISYWSTIPQVRGILIDAVEKATKCYT